MSFVIDTEGKTNIRGNIGREPDYIKPRGMEIGKGKDNTCG